MRERSISAVRLSALRSTRRLATQPNASNRPIAFELRKALNANRSPRPTFGALRRGAPPKHSVQNASTDLSKTVARAVGIPRAPSFKSLIESYERLRRGDVEERGQLLKLKAALGEISRFVERRLGAAERPARDRREKAAIAIQRRVRGALARKRFRALKAVRCSRGVQTLSSDDSVSSDSVYCDRIGMRLRICTQTENGKSPLSPKSEKSNAAPSAKGSKSVLHSKREMLFASLPPKLIASLTPQNTELRSSSPSKITNVKSALIQKFKDKNIFIDSKECNQTNSILSKKDCLSSGLTPKPESVTPSLPPNPESIRSSLLPKPAFAPSLPPKPESVTPSLLPKPKSLAPSPPSNTGLTPSLPTKPNSLTPSLPPNPALTPSLLSKPALTPSLPPKPESLTPSLPPNSALTPSLPPKHDSFALSFPLKTAAGNVLASPRPSIASSADAWPTAIDERSAANLSALLENKSGLDVSLERRNTALPSGLVDGGAADSLWESLLNDLTSDLLWRKMLRRGAALRVDLSAVTLYCDFLAANVGDDFQLPISMCEEFGVQPLNALQRAHNRAIVDAFNEALLRGGSAIEAKRRVVEAAAIACPSIEDSTIDSANGEVRAERMRRIVAESLSLGARRSNDCNLRVEIAAAIESELLLDTLKAFGKGR